MERKHTEYREQKPHCLSLCGRIILFQCKRSSANRESERNASELTFSSLSFQQGANAFLKANDGVSVIIRKGSSSDVDIVKCKCVLDVQKRVTTPCVLLTQSKKGGSFKYSLLTLSNSNRLEPHMEFKLPYRMREDVSILQGPTVLWTHGGAVFYTSLRAGEVKQIPVQFSPSLIGELPLNKGKSFILGQQSPSKGCSKEQTNSIGGGQTLGYFVEDGLMFDGTLILPHAYSSITNCLLVVSAEQTENGMLLKSTVVAVTHRRQLVYFENGIPREVCPLPFEGPVDIQIVDTGRDGCLFAISFAQGHVCTVRKDTFQVASCWSGVRSLHVDDFLGCGTDQMLLVFEDQPQTVQHLDHFLITDLCGTTYSRGIEGGGGLKATVPAQENYLLTLQALDSRLQSGLSMLQVLQRDVRVKERVLLQSVQALTDVVTGKEPVLTQYEQEGLTALWDADDQSKDEALEDKMQDAPAVSSKPQVDKLWHRIIEDRLVVGVMLTTDGSIPVGSLSLSVLTEKGQSLAPAVIQTHSRVSWLPTPCPLPPPPSSSLNAHPEPAAKRSRQEDGASGVGGANACRLVVTAVTEVAPLLNPGGVKCPVMLHYVPGLGSSAPWNKPALPTMLHCGQVLVDIQTSDFKTRLLRASELTTDEAREDLLSLLAVLDRWVFQIDSPDHSLGDVEGWIQRMLACEKLKVNPQYLLTNPEGPSALMLLHWQQKTPFQGQLSVHSSQLRMLHFLDSLWGLLPASCTIQPLREVGREGAAQLLAQALEREVLSLKEGVSSLLSGAKEEEEEEEEEKKKSTGPRQPEVPGPGSVEGLQRCREEWERDVERSRRRLSPLVDVGSYRRLTQSLSTVQLEGDMAALLETQREASFDSGLH